MKSRLSIEVDFDNGNQPVIQILASYSDDVRDKLVQAFLQSLQHSSRWCTIRYCGEGERPMPSYEQTYRWVIQPITLDEIPSEIKLMEAAIK